MLMMDNAMQPQPDSVLNGDETVLVVDDDDTLNLVEI